MNLLQLESALYDAINERSETVAAWDAVCKKADELEKLFFKQKGVCIREGLKRNFYYVEQSLGMTYPDDNDAF